MATDQLPASDIRTQKTTGDLRNSLSDKDSGGKYSIKQLTFPQDLFAAGPTKYGNGWMMININMLEQSKYLPESTQANLSDAEQKLIKARRQTQADQRDNSVAGAISKLTAAGAAVGAAKGVSDVKIADVINSKGKVDKAGAAKAGAQVFGKAIVGGVVGGATAAAPLLLAQTAKRETKRIAAAIVLPMPNAFVTQYNTRWGEDNTAMFDAIMRGIPTNAVDAGSAAAALALSANSFVNARGLSAATGLAVNPRKEMYFESVGFRQFTLNYKMYPKNEQEAQNIKNIIFQLKFHMHPEYKGQERYTFVYPSEFDITFYKSDQENTWVNKIATSVLTDLSVNYTPDGLWAAHSDGQPAAVDVSMSFRELSVLTKEMIDEGY